MGEQFEAPPISTALAYGPAVDKLESITQSANILSLAIVIMTAINFFNFVATVVSSKVDIRKLLAVQGDFDFDRAFIFGSCISMGLFVMVVLMLIRYERAVSMGDIFYQELSDHFEWEEASPDARLDTRIKLKQFLLSTTLPLARDRRLGPAFYILFNAMFSIGAVLVPLFLFK